MVDNTPDGLAAIGWASNWAGRLRTPGGAGDLGAGFLLIVIATFADADGHANPSLDTLADITNRSPTTVTNALKRLAKVHGLVEIDQHRGNPRYRLLLGRKPRYLAQKRNGR